ncbi:hypothetical protein BURPS1655_A1915 [Burkholderia pseudomallei 1655]|nr:hypothetical protein BURPS1655_A1915 [Burkholderia pseudomallei 1655]
MQATRPSRLDRSGRSSFAAAGRAGPAAGARRPVVRQSRISGAV